MSQSMKSPVGPIDPEIVSVPANYENQLLIAVLPRVGLSRSVVDAIVLVTNGAVLVDGRAVKDLNYRLPAHCLLMVGDKGVELTCE